ncbi:GNAT family N-acetyltransferase [Spiractinospora alimapuensis]|uniref:GNAT family N-acetyltransferase n=1 Tax=Spiractinospora alimapuensis TaxID=2820884 RepID=UPI001F33A0A3|nr:GNAT family protein [Spiractinospora alimapuensis]QVQ51838.1 GNAT family N-acetyltransferase [Spiractinospora alimapuensis]
MQGTLIDLRPPRLSEFDDICDWITGGSDSAGFLNTQITRHDPAKVREAYLNKEISLLMIVDKRKNPIGIIIIKTAGFYRNYEVTVAVGDRRKWHLGFGAEAMARATEVLFMSYDAHRVQFMTASYNHRMLDMLISNFANLLTIDGIMRDALFLDGEYHDMIVWSILRDEYFQIDAVQPNAPDMGPIPPTIPLEEKEKARKILASHLADNPRTSISLAQSVRHGDSS